MITGASTGFGKLTADLLLEKRHTVVASMRNVNGKNKKVAAELTAKGATIVELDVTDEASVENAISEAIEKAGHIDAIFNNAGLGVLGIQETFTIEDWQKVFEVNVFGVQRVNRAILPHFKSRGTGLLIYTSSLLGRMVLPFYGPYNASKWALEAMAENYRVELNPLGIDSCIVEPGGFPTDFFGNLLQASDAARADSYGPMKDSPKQLFDSFEGALAQNELQKPSLVAEKVLELLEMPAGERPFRSPVDKMGMGDPIVGYNEQLENIMKGIYGNFGMDAMLNLNE
ncbi:short-chain dehydrogenase/reductase [Persicobacter diffluens]|uniref:Short-chain dehydrogenase/reductase n=2 Tax=Persicobacter diffluens TaxID=981 RepID=A0AAN5AL57_9BACT|nr:short-chain dehydrogenase/reductase [Persicobacter diffluens]